MALYKGAKSDKEWRAAIQRAVKRTIGDGKTKRLEALADTIVNAGLAGDIAAIKEIGDRLDGKPNQAIETAFSAGESFIALLRMVNENRSRPQAVAEGVDTGAEQPAPLRH